MQSENGQPQRQLVMYEASMGRQPSIEGLFKILVA